MERHTRTTHETYRPLDRDRTRETNRAQTTLDFAIGASTFLVVVLFVVAFLPGMLTPFEDVDPTQSADRFADSLSGDMLGHPADGNRLNDTCTAAFFVQLERDSSTGIDCRFDAGATTPAEALATDHAVNVTIESRSPEGASPTLTHNGTVTLAAGPTPHGVDTVTTARRTVLLENGSDQQRTYRLVVRVW